MHSAWQYLCSVRFYVVVVVFCFIFFRLICCRRFFKFYFSVFFFLSPLLGAESVCVCAYVCPSHSVKLQSPVLVLLLCCFLFRFTADQDNSLHIACIRSCVVHELCFYSFFSSFFSLHFKSFSSTFHLYFFFSPFSFTRVIFFIFFFFFCCPYVLYSVNYFLCMLCMLPIAWLH